MTRPGGCDRQQPAEGRGGCSKGARRRMTRAVFLDRDGVLNKAYVRNGKPYSPDTIEEMIIAPDAAETVERLREHGFRLLLATNQPDIARGRLTRAHVDAMNAHLAGKVPLD